MGAPETGLRVEGFTFSENSKSRSGYRRPLCSRLPTFSRASFSHRPYEPGSAVIPSFQGKTQVGWPGRTHMLPASVRDNTVFKGGASRT